MAGTGAMQMDPLFLAMSFYRRRKFEECAEVCTQLLKKNPYDQVMLSLYSCMGFTGFDTCFLSRILRLFVLLNTV